MLLPEGIWLMTRPAGPPGDQVGRAYGSRPLDDVDADVAAANYRLVQRISIMVSALAVAAIAVHLIWPALKIDLVTVALLVFGSLPWLRGIIRTIGLPGGASIEMREDYYRARAVAREERQTAEAVRTVGTAKGAASDVERVAQIEEQAQRYERVRRQLPSGPERTGEMGAAARKILGLLPADGLDTSRELLSPKAGERLVAYLSLMADPDAAYGEQLIETLTEREGIPYNQNWAVRALSLILERNGSGWISFRSIAMLTGMRDGLRPGSDRQAMLADLVDQITQS
jgi:hypothetical protein